MLRSYRSIACDSELVTCEVVYWWKYDVKAENVSGLCVLLGYLFCGWNHYRFHLVSSDLVEKPYHLFFFPDLEIGLASRPKPNLTQ